MLEELLALGHIGASGADPVRVFESGSILVYLAEKLAFQILRGTSQEEGASTISQLF